MQQLQLAWMDHWWRMRSIGLRQRLLGSLLVALAAGCSSTTPPAGPIVIQDTPPTPKQSVPASIQIPAIKVDAPLVPLGLNKDGTIQVPDLNHVYQVSWYCQDYKDDDGTPTCAGGGVIPGNVGAAATYGHIDGHRRDGAYRHIMELNLGDPINIKRADGSTLTFKVYKVQQVRKSAFPSEQVYGNVNRPEIRLITCTGEFIGGNTGYRDQGIVYAALG